ncbi:MAG: alpha/beta hydrolase-fold protein [Pirellulaceae bacterium]|nr:alpha/beta hydrolase-fold protein [Pirellulaceae bacterium]
MALPLVAAVAAADQVEITPAVVRADGVRVHEVRSEFQAGVTQIRVLSPPGAKPAPVIYLLPVEARSTTRWGDAIAEILARGLHERFRAVYVAPTFSHLPWYADHPEDEAIRQESYLLKVVVPFVERTYPTRAQPDHRLLLGFSKSGWGAYSLLARHPDLFGRAAAWDAPLMMSAPGKYGSGPIFGGPANFERYQLTRLIARSSTPHALDRRLVLLGYDNFRNHHEQFHQHLLSAGIGHVYRDGPQRKHHWNSGWVGEAVELLIDAPRAGAEPADEPAPRTGQRRRRGRNEKTGGLRKVRPFQSRRRE